MIIKIIQPDGRTEDISLANLSMVLDGAEHAAFQTETADRRVVQLHASRAELLRLAAETSPAPQPIIA